MTVPVEISGSGLKPVETIFTFVLPVEVMPVSPAITGGIELESGGGNIELESGQGYIKLENS